ncbi:MAG: DUF2950 domain-containing protein [Deltaproteobacteria bacterium]|nr:DUF2950 domain-containing protein [Deltaproteobacteria bacterium]
MAHVKSMTQKVSVFRSGIRILLLSGVILSLATTVLAAQVKQKTFASPEAAVNALVEAVKTHNDQELLAIFGAAGKELIFSENELDDKEGREQFVKSHEQKNTIEAVTADKAVLHVGQDGWAFPVPIIKKGDAWVFDVKAGKQELFARWIGRNELNIIDFMKAYVEAQREYARRDPAGNQAVTFAQKMISDPDLRDGLYWETEEQETKSLIDPLAAGAARFETVGRKGELKLASYHGYYFKILKSQGNHAQGGESDYVVNGKMTLGFALVAFPARYGDSGIMSFIVNQQGIVYEKNLGKNTGQIVKAMKQYDPDQTWKKVE